ncbi:MAG: hypothetical protein BWX98_01235 [Candidatus Aminicenantes bacterium ADurb.Bin147]|nr:MAG: hypothetical protein BWX98_01235 [Candidatus Aminicenantes bacterium ADurb.Bin147]
MGRAGFSGSRLRGVTYISKWGERDVTRNLAIARILIPRPGLNVSPIQGENSPFFKANALPEIWIRAVSLAVSIVIRRGSLISAGSRSMVFSGPGRNVSTRLSFTSTGKKTPPSAFWILAGSDVKKENVPWLPLRSGAHIPERRWPLNFSGGKVIGTRSTVLMTPFSPRIFQKGILLRSPWITGLDSGTWYRPIRIVRLGLEIRAEERSGR